MADEGTGGSRGDLDAPTPVSFMSRRNSWDLQALAGSLLSRYKRGESVDGELNAVAEELTERGDFQRVVVHGKARPKFKVIQGKES